MKDVLVAGDTLDFTTSVPDYPPSIGYTLVYRLIPRSIGATPIRITASATADDNYRVTEIPATTAGWVPGEYTEAAWIEKSGERYTVDGAALPFAGNAGLCTILPDPATVASWDGRSQAQKALDDAKVALANFQATGGRVKRYAIAGREMEFDNAGDILTLVSYWQAQVTREAAANAVRQGLADPRRIYVRLANA